jgi:hypothetical protein
MRASVVFGYQPVAVYWAEQDLVVADEYRDGHVPAGMENLPLIRQAFQDLPAAVTERYFRADSACYDARVLKWLANDQRVEGPQGWIGFTISADMTRELHEACTALSEEDWQLLEHEASCRRFQSARFDGVRALAMALGPR